MRNIYDLLDTKQARRLKNLLSDLYHIKHNNQRRLIEMAFMKTHAAEEIEALNITSAEIEMACQS